MTGDDGVELTSEQRALADVLASDPGNQPIRLLLARSLAQAGQGQAALSHFAQAASSGPLTADDQRVAAELALASGDLELARRFLDANEAPASPPPPMPPGSGLGPDELLRPVDGVGPGAATGPGEPEAVRGGPPELRPRDLIEGGADMVSFADIGGLADVKKAIDRLIVQPLQRPDLFEKYGKRAGGGVLLYGPPGCGKTMVARATASELGLPFYNVRVEDIVDPYFGVSEQRLADAFEAARELRPCVLFIDELDSLGYARSKQSSERARALVEVLLQQLDSIGSDNAGVLVLSAINEPWDIDTALLRPGRFDRTIFVPPPDGDARRTILEGRLLAVPHRGLDVRGLVNDTELYSGADLGALVDRAVEEVIDHALDTGQERDLGPADIAAAVAETRPTTVPWLSRARNHVEFGNVGGRWDDVERYLKQRKVAKLLRRSEKLIDRSGDGAE